MRLRHLLQRWLVLPRLLPAPSHFRQRERPHREADCPRHGEHDWKTAASAGEPTECSVSVVQLHDDLSRQGEFPGNLSRYEHLVRRRTRRRDDSTSAASYKLACIHGVKL